MKIDLLEIDVTQALDFRFDLVEVFVELLQSFLVRLRKGLAAQQIGADLNGGERVVEFVTDRDDEFADRLSPLFGDEHPLFDRFDLLVHTNAVEHVDDRSREDRFSKIFFDQKVFHAELHRLDGEFEVPRRGDENNGNLAVHLVELQTEFQSVGAWKDVIRKNEINGGVLLDFGEGVFHVLFPDELELAILEFLQVVLNEFRKADILVYQQNGDRLLLLRERGLRHGDDEGKGSLCELQCGH